MLKVKNKFIMDPIIAVLETLRIELNKSGIDKLKDIKPSNDNIQVTCPSHKSGKEKKPSCGVLLTPKDGREIGTVHCFTCGYTAEFDEFVSNCFGRDDVGRFGANWLIENFIVGVPNDRTVPTISRKKHKEEIEFVSEEELDSYRFVHNYMYQRKLTDEIIEKFDVGYDYNTNCLTFPVWDNKGKCLFVARRGVKTKYFKYPQGVKKPVYGYHFIIPSIKSVIVCESIINALTCWVYGKPAVALIGLGNKQQMQELKELNVRKLVLALDPDEEGERATSKIKNILKNSGKAISELIVPKGSDINDLSEDEFNNLQEFY